MVFFYILTYKEEYPGPFSVNPRPALTTFDKKIHEDDVCVCLSDLSLCFVCLSAHQVEIREYEYDTG